LIHQHKSPHLLFGNRMVGPGHPVLIIAEIGINHEGRIDDCLEMIDQAAAAGADAVKLQFVKADESYVPGTESHTIFKNAELSDTEIERAFIHATETGVVLFCTCGDFVSLETVNRFSPVAYKISSGLLTHLPLIDRVACTGKAIFISTGMADQGRIRQAVKTATAAGCVHIGLFQCTSLYPAPWDKLNLSVISYLENKFGVPAGFSDHSLGVRASSFAVAAGARMIEKHFSLNPSRKGFDHAVSASPDEFVRMVNEIRQVEEMMGSIDGKAKSVNADKRNRLYRYIVARRDIAKDAIFEEDDIGVMRVKESEHGLSPSYFATVIGKTARRDIRRYKPLVEKDYR